MYVPLRRMDSYTLLHQRPKAERKNISGLPEYANCERWTWWFSDRILPLPTKKRYFMVKRWFPGRIIVTTALFLKSLNYRVIQLHSGVPDSQ